jgi:hypothetical protein
MVTKTFIEGWHTDPYGLHDARWMSEGVPTKLVLDQGKESYDTVPSGEAVFEPQRYEFPSAINETWALHGDEIRALSFQAALRKAAAKVLHPING